MSERRQPSPFRIALLLAGLAGFLVACGGPRLDRDRVEAAVEAAFATIGRVIRSPSMRWSGLRSKNESLQMILGHDRDRPDACSLICALTAERRRASSAPSGLTR